MRKREQYKRLIMFIASAFIWGLQTGLFAYIWYTEYSFVEVIGIIFWRRGNWVVIGLYGLILFFFNKIYGAFKIGYLRTMDVLYSQVLSIICVNFIAYLQIALIGRLRFGMHILPMVKMTVTELLVTVIWVIFMRWVYTKIYPPKSILLIYGDINPKALIQKISTRKDKYQISRMMHINSGMEEIKKQMGQYDAVMFGDIPSESRNPLLKYGFEQSIRCYMVPKISDIMIKSAEPIHLFDTQLQLCRNNGLSAEQRATKRIIDIVCSVLGLIIAAPFMVVIALAIKLYDRGPVFYKQERLTLNGQKFMVYKFRSMRMDSEKDGAQLAKKHDSRVTPVGKVIRNLHLDELPQILNILKGEMSIVGPRPEREEITQAYTKEIPEFPYRLKVKAGLTGYAQVYGKYNTTPYDKLKLDLTYIENYSVWMDFKLMMLTFKILFQKENTEGVEDWQITALKEPFNPEDGK